MTRSLKNPKVSIITAAYNAEEHIAETVESVLKQTFTDWEYIVVDDGSRDSTQQVLKPYLHRIRYIFQPNAGQTVARNTAFQQASGDHIAIIDADDMWHPEKLERQVFAIESDPGIGMVYTNWKKIDDQGKPIPSDPVPDVTVDPWGYELFEHYIPFSSMLLRRVAIKGKYLLHPGLRHATDWHLALSILANGYQYAFLEVPLLFYRVHLKAETYTPHKRDTKVTEGKIVLDNIFERMQGSNTFNWRVTKRAYANVYLRGAANQINFGGSSLVAWKYLLNACRIDLRAAYRVARFGIKLILRPVWSST